MKPVRMKDIARDLGVSVITVSKALRDHSDISTATRARVLKRVKELNYKPNYAARALVTGRSNMIGLVVPDLVHSFYSEIGNGLGGVLRKAGYNLVISSSEEDQEVENQVIDQLIARRVDCLVIASSNWTASALKRVVEANIPFVLIDRRVPGIDANFVGGDDELIGVIATEHLIEVGCKVVAHIGGSKVSPARGRLEGYKKTLAKHRLTLGPEYIVTHDTLDEMAHEVGYESAMTLLKLRPRPDGIFCFSDPLAIGTMRAILDAGLRVPEDVALVGCGNLHYDVFLRIPLTSVDQQSFAIGERAATLAIAMIDAESQGGPKPKGKSILLQPKLIIRESTYRKIRV
ncbi:MAG: LacI family DNA-binding transcriptional regulator [Candidatus Acidiferrales bacterium]|jgi:LacI family transcriptional regulator